MVRSYGCVLHTHTRTRINNTNMIKRSTLFFSSTVGTYSWYMYVCNNACPLFSPHTPAHTIITVGKNFF